MRPSQSGEARDGALLNSLPDDTGKAITVIRNVK
jgi:hypothetical protein